MATRESEDFVSHELGVSLPNCAFCNHVVSDVIYLYKPPCGHSMHKSCFQKNVKTKPNCPNCNQRLSVATPSDNTNIPPPMITRSQTKRASSFDVNRSGPISSPPTVSNRETNSTIRMSMSDSSPQDQRDHLRNLVTAAVGAQQAEMLTSLSQTLTSLIETNIEAGFRRLNLNNPSVGDNRGAGQHESSLSQQSIEGLLGLPPTNSNYNRGTNEPNSNSTTFLRLDLTK